MDSPTPFAAIAASAGLLSHWLWFIHGEHDFLVLHYLAAIAGIEGLGFFVLTRVAEQPALVAIGTLALLSASYCTALFSSILLYRGLFHKLHRFPGPLSWRLTKFAQVAANADAKGYLHLDALHAKYGPIVRIGPNQLSVVAPDALGLVLGPGSKCTKPAWYDVGVPLVSVHTCRDKKLHDIRRRAWDKGLNAKSLRDYESRVSSYADLLMRQLRAFSGAAVSASKWFNYYSFDVMGDLAFGKSFDMLSSGEKHFAIRLLDEGMAPMNFIPAIPWLFYLLMRVPVVSRNWIRFIKWSEEQVENRKKFKPAEPDIMTHLLAAAPMSSNAGTQKQWEVGDSRLIIVAGSDTTAASLSYAVYELARHPDVMGALRTAVRELQSADGTFDPLALRDCALLNAVIDDSLRLHPPVPAGLIRIVPPEGMQLGGAYIPPETIVTLPLYSIQRSQEAYSHPHEFLPERWTTRPELVKRKGAFAPFSLGAFGCVGKQLAYMEVRTVLAKLLTAFDVQFAPGDDGRAFIERTEDHFTLSLADLNLRFVPLSS